MSARENAFARHRQSRWMQPGARRWLRPDAARYQRPGANLSDAFLALGCKYNASQPRVPAGNSDGGQWTSGNSGGSNAVAQPTGMIDFSELLGLNDLSGLFSITPNQSDLDGLTQLAGDFPAGDGSDPPSNEPPEIPIQRPETGGPVMKFIREAVAWTGRVGRYSPYADTFFGALKQVDETNAITNVIKSANDPPRTLEELQDRVLLPDRSGYHRHHIAEEKAARNSEFSESLIQGRDNLVLVPLVKHIDITKYYATKVRQADGSRISPRESIQGMSFEERRQFGLRVLRDHGVLK